MTAKRRFEGSTEFGLWLRDQDEVDSSKGFIASNIDFIWMNYKTGEFMLIEEKRYNGRVWSKAQRTLFNTLHKSICSQKYRGFFQITFEKTNPDDGKIYIGKNKEEISKIQLIQFLQFKLNPKDINSTCLSE